MPLPWHKTSVTTQQLKLVTRFFPLYPPLHHLFTQCGTPIPPSVDLMLSSILPAQASAFCVLCPILRALVVPLLGGVLHTGAHSSVSIFHSSVSSGVPSPPMSCVVLSTIYILKGHLFSQSTNSYKGIHSQGEIIS